MSTYVVPMYMRGATMSEEAQGPRGTAVDDATAAANAAIHAALDMEDRAGDPTVHEEPSDAGVAAAPGTWIGHGEIRLRSQPSPRLEDTTPGVTVPDAAATREPSGHGAVRLLIRSDGSPPSADVPAVAAAPATSPGGAT